MSLGFSIKEGIKGFGRARMATFVTITSVVLALIMIGLFILLAINIDRWVGEKRKHLEVEVFLEPGFTEAQAQKIVQKLKELPGVRTVRYISQEEAARRFKKEFGRDVQEVLGTNPLPPSCILRLQPAYQNAESIKRLSRIVRTWDGVSDVVYGQELLKVIDRYVTLIYLIIGGLGLVLLIVATVLVHNAIRLIIYARHETIEIMKLVGATRAFIRRPFLVEGILYGAIGGAIADVVIWILMGVMKNWVYADIIQNWQTYAIVLALGILIGFISSELSVNKYLNKLI
ncbi:hypothetical protein DRI50_03390 [candidate division KSB1 bacterium]|nr:MAG: hypothetical protein DRI50_03390 [candidate division KSB1 bacterium]